MPVLALLVAALAVPLVPPLPGAGALAVAAAVWALTRRRSPGYFGVLVSLGLAALLLLAAGLSWKAGRDLGPDEIRSSLRADFEQLWSALDRQAEAAAAALPSDPQSAPWSSYQILRRRMEGSSGPGLTLLLIDPDGEPLVWAGRGLLYEPREAQLPRKGRTWWTGFTASTLVSVAPVETTGRPWRVVAGRSLSTDRLPFEPTGDTTREEFRWAPVGREDDRAREGFVVPLERGSGIAVRRVSGRARPSGDRDWRRAAAGALAGFALLVAAASRIGAGARGGFVAVGLPLLGGLLALALAGGVSPAGIAALELGACLCLLAWRPIRPGSRGGRWGPGACIAIGVAAIGVAAGGAVLAQHLAGLRDLGSTLAPSPESAAWMLGLWGLLLSPFLLVGGAGRGETGEGRSSEEEVSGFWSGASSLAALLLGAALLSTPLFGIAVAGVGTAFGLIWARNGRWRRRPVGALVLAVLSGLAAATVWEGAYRLEMTHRIEHTWLSDLEAPPSASLERIWRRLDRHFARRELTSLVPRAPAGMRVRDLAYELWRRSPLARHDALTAVVARPLEGDPIAFAYGLPLTTEGELDREPGRWRGAAVRAWQERLVSGRGTLTADGELWGEVEYWLLPLPGFDREAAPVRDLASGLLRGGPVASEVMGELPPEVRPALYGRDGELSWSPWAEAPPLPRRLLEAGTGVVESAGREVRVFTRRVEDGFAALFLPRLTWSRALERVGSQVFASLAGVGALALLLLPWVRPGFATFPAIRGALRSYSTRLLVVYGLLLLVPLGLLELLLVRSFEDRLRREQRMAGQAALTSAQQVLGDFILSLEPGFGIETALDDALLGWISRVIHHEVNLYWGNGINASSKRELFSAGLLPARIPGEIHSRLAFRGDELAWRTTRAGDARYLEIYAPLRIPEMGDEGAPRLVLSLPLLAQQEEVAEELADLRRRSILLTLLVGLVAALVGTRSARTFTRPLEALVRGTDRIASGASSLAMERPRDVELAALVDAIDEMAERIAEARERLLREKQVVDRIVQHIATGIVSLDEGGRVLMINRLARELLSVDLGQPLLGAIEKEEGLEELTGFVRAARSRLAEDTVELIVEGEERDFRLVWVPVPGEGDPSSLLVLEDVTEVLRAQRLEAWAEMARVIAHEVKNPLTPIRLSAEHMMEVYERDREAFEPVFERCVDNILRQVEELRQIAGEFSTYSSIPVLSRESTDLVETLERLAEGYRPAATEGVEVRFRPRVSRLETQVDERLLRRAVRNLVENAVRACSNQGGGAVEIDVASEENRAVIRVRDDGPGMDPELLPRIFDPNFSTDDRGTGLGLPIARRVVEEHGGTLVARNREEGGLEMTITVPLS